MYTVDHNNEVSSQTGCFVKLVDRSIYMNVSKIRKTVKSTHLFVKTGFILYGNGCLTFIRSFKQYIITGIYI